MSIASFNPVRYHLLIEGIDVGTPNSIWWILHFVGIFNQTAH